MTPRRTSRRPRRRQQIEENLVDKVRLAEFKADFAHEITQICNLAPLKARPDLIDDFLLTLDEIVGLARRRLDVDQKERVIESIRASKDAADKIPAIAAALAKMDAQQLENILSIAIEVCPRSFLKNKGPLEIFHLLRDVTTLLLTLHAAIQLGTGKIDQPTGRGRPSSPYVQPNSRTHKGLGGGHSRAVLDGLATLGRKARPDAEKAGSQGQKNRYEAALDRIYSHCFTDDRPEYQRSTSVHSHKECTQPER